MAQPTTRWSITYWANPGRFRRLATRSHPYLVCATALTWLIGLWFALHDSPPDYQQGQSVRIMYVHVPSAWMALSCYLMLASACAISLIWRHLLADIAARAIAPVGAVFTALALLTGSLWGRPMWGAWWVWDARLTSVLILFFLYLGFLALVDLFDNPERGSRAGSMLVLAGVVNLPIIKYSVTWWNTLHQPSSISRLAKPAIDPAMLHPLLIMALGFFLFAVAVIFIGMRARLAEYATTGRMIRGEG